MDPKVTAGDTGGLHGKSRRFSCSAGRGRFAGSLRSGVAVVGAVLVTSLGCVMAPTAVYQGERLPPDQVATVVSGDVDVRLVSVDQVDVDFAAEVKPGLHEVVAYIQDQDGRFELEYFCRIPVRLAAGHDYEIRSDVVDRNEYLTGRIKLVNMDLQLFDSDTGESAGRCDCSGRRLPLDCS